MSKRDAHGRRPEPRQYVPGLASAQRRKRSLAGAFPKLCAAVGTRYFARKTPISSLTGRSCILENRNWDGLSERRKQLRKRQSSRDSSRDERVLSRHGAWTHGMSSIWATLRSATACNSHYSYSYSCCHNDDIQYFYTYVPKELIGAERIHPQLQSGCL